jgi:hypothetical protein
MVFASVSYQTGGFGVFSSHTDRFLEHSQTMAENVSQWVKQIIRVHKEESSQTFVWR